MLKLELGSGAYPTPSYLHCDIRRLPEIGIVCNLQALPFKDEIFDEVLSKHVIEHFSWRETCALLAEWVRVLKKGGKFSVQCPNFAYLCHYYSAYFAGKTKTSVWISPESDFYGAQDYEFNFHKTSFSFETLYAKLEGAGICEIIGLTDIGKHHNAQYQLHLEGRKK